MTDAANPLITPSPLPFAMPDYPHIRPEHYLPAFTQAFADQLAEIAAITAQAEPATFENTLLPLEESGDLLGRVARTFYTVASADATPAIQEIDETLAPLMSAHQDAIQLDAELYARVSAVHDTLDAASLADA